MPRTAAKPNILWFCADQQRHDTIRALGNAHIRTPNIDSLCASGAAFERAYVQGQICTVSRASFLTGRYPAAHQVYRNGGASWPVEETMVTKILADAGYHCGLIGKMHVLSASAGYEPRADDGYRTWHWSHTPRPEDGTSNRNAYHQWLRAKGVDPYELYAGVDAFCGPGVPAALSQNEWMTETAIEFINARKGGPWLLSLNPFAPHHPLDPPPEFLSRVNAADLPPPLFWPEDIERQKQFREIQQTTLDALDPSHPTNPPFRPMAGTITTIMKPPPFFNGRLLKAHYYAMIEHLDHCLGRIVEAVKSVGELDNTVVVYTSDHGDHLGDHGLLFKGARFFDSIVRVPLIISWPGTISPGLRSDALVEEIDIAPTLLEAAGLPVPSRMQGRSLMKIATGEANPHRHKDVVICDYNQSMGYLSVPRRTVASMVFDGRFKTCVYQGHDLVELFDLEEDPGEFDNLWTKPGNETLKREAMRRHVESMMTTVWARPVASTAGNKGIY